MVGEAKQSPADRPIAWKLWTVLALLGPEAWALQALCAQDPEATDRLYSQGLYPLVQSVLAAISGWLPFALGEMLLLGGIALVLWRCVRGLRAWRAGSRSFRNLIARAALQVAGAAGVLFLVFQLVWGLNHARRPFAEHVDLDVREVEPTVLAQVTRRLAQRAGARRPDVLPDDRDEWIEAALDAYELAGMVWPVLDGPRPAVRFPWISPLMTLASITGIYSPFTGEPNVNGDLPMPLLPFVALHEVAHQRGFAREDEANFIAWWVGSRSGDPFVAYSCELMAYRHALGQLFREDPGLALAVAAETPAEVSADVEAIRSFWIGQSGIVHEVVSRIAVATNDVYLKSSGHAEGVRSYGRMVDLLIAVLAD